MNHILQMMTLFLVTLLSVSNAKESRLLLAKCPPNCGCAPPIDDRNTCCVNGIEQYIDRCHAWCYGCETQPCVLGQCSP